MEIQSPTGKLLRKSKKFLMSDEQMQWPWGMKKREQN